MTKYLKAKNRLLVAAKAAIALGIVLQATTAAAGIVSVGGQAQIVQMPSDVRFGALTSPLTSVMAESSGVLLNQPIMAEITQPGAYSYAYSLVPQAVAPGTIVDSYLVHFDAPGASGISVGTITFDTQVLGIITDNWTSLVFSDAIVGRPGTVYEPSGGGRGWFDIDDLIDLSGDRKTIGFQAVVGGYMDEFRIITAAAPQATVSEPETLMMVGIGLIGMIFRRRRT